MLNGHVKWKKQFYNRTSSHTKMNLGEGIIALWNCKYFLDAYNIPHASIFYITKPERSFFKSKDFINLNYTELLEDQSGSVGRFRSTHTVPV